MVAEGDRLRRLQMGKAGHDGIGLTLRQVQQAALKPGKFGGDMVDFVTQPEADVGGHLVVAGAAGVKFFPGGAYVAGKGGLDIHMHVFEVRGPVEVTGVDGGQDFFQADGNLPGLFGAQHAHFGKHGGMGEGAANILAVEPAVEVHGGGKAGHEGIRGLGETPSPGLVGLFFSAHACLSKLVLNKWFVVH